MKNRLLKWFDVIRYFFPFQLMFLHFRKNIFGLLVWAILFGFVQGLSDRFGVPQLFLSPEYLGMVDNISFAILGFGFGGFVAAYNLYSYVVLGPNIPFLGTVKRPLLVFSLNNMLIPLVFLVLYGAKMIPFQSEQELKDGFTIFLHVIFMMVGMFVFLFSSYLYFFKTNKNIFKISGRSEAEYEADFKGTPVESVLMKEESWFHTFRKLKFRRHYYITERFTVRIARDWMHYDKNLIERVFYQNHVNTSLFEIIIITSFFIFGIFGDFQFFVIPAGASIFLIFSILLMLISALYSWLRSWTYLVLLLSFGLFNYLSQKPNFEQFRYPIIGLDYDVAKHQNKDSIFAAHTNMQRIEKEKESYSEILKKWKNKQTNSKKPKLFILNVSGGGSRSALWSFLVMRQLDSLTKGEFSNSVHMITGASGGIIGAAYYRQLLLEKNNDPDFNIHNHQYVDNISKEMLNAVSTAIATRDIFFKFRKFEYNGNKYLMDRGHSFELQLHRNTNFVMEKTLGDYAPSERNAEIPVMVFSPTLINDGRRLLVSSVETGFYQTAYANRLDDFLSGIEDLEYRLLLKDFNPDATRFSSVLRMSATFPYILPMLALPGDLNYHAMDAGIRDNMGTKTTLKFMKAYEDWMVQNTSGVVIVRIRDVSRHTAKKENKRYGISDKLFLPLGNMLQNFIHVQDHEQDDLLSLVVSNYRVPVSAVSFDLREKNEDEVALSFRLTNYEKKMVEEKLNVERNQKAFYNVMRLLGKL